MTDNNLKNYFVTTNSDQSIFDPNEGNLFVVDSLNREMQVNVFLRHDGGVVSEFEGLGERDDWGDYEAIYIKAECPTHDDFKKYLDDARLILPVGFLKAMDSEILPTSNTYQPVLADILALKGEPFVASWSLSYESPDDDDNYHTASTLSEAMNAIGESGALQAIPGNFSSVKVGSLELCHTVFRSDGMDNGDSHANPRMATENTNLFKEIIEYEQKKQKDLEARIDRRKQQNSNNGFSL